MLPLLDDHTRILNRYMQQQSMHRYKTSVGSQHEQNQERSDGKQQIRRQSSNSLPKLQKLHQVNKKPQKKWSFSPYKSSPTRLVSNGSVFLKFWKTEKQVCSKLSKEICQIEKQIRRCQRRLQKQNAGPKVVSKTPQKCQKKQQKTAFLTEINENSDYTQCLAPQNIDYVKQCKESMQNQYKHELKDSYIRRRSLIEPRKPDLNKLNILGQRNSLPKFGKPLTNNQHIFRVLTKEGTPVRICPSVPKFGCVRNPQAKSVLSYCLDNRSFMEGNIKNLKRLLKPR